MQRGKNAARHQCSHAFYPVSSGAAPPARSTSQSSSPFASVTRTRSQAKQNGSDTLRKELLETIRRELGPVAVIGELNFVNMLPKTRSGKIMRRVLKAVTLGKEPGDITTIEDEGSVEEARHAWEDMKTEIAKQRG